MFPNATLQRFRTRLITINEFTVEGEVAPVPRNPWGKISHCRKVNLSNNSLLSLTLALSMETTKKTDTLHFSGGCFFRCCIHQGLPNSGSLEILCGSLRRQWTLAAPDHGPVLGLGDWAATKLGKSSLKGNSPQGGGFKNESTKNYCCILVWFWKE